MPTTALPLLLSGTLIDRLLDLCLPRSEGARSHGETTRFLNEKNSFGLRGKQLQTCGEEKPLCREKPFTDG